MGEKMLERCRVLEPGYAAETPVVSARNYPKDRQSRLRDSINGGMCIERLQRHVRGEQDMSASQVSAAKILLDRVLPVLMSAELQVQRIEVPRPEQIIDRINMLLASHPELALSLAPSPPLPIAVDVVDDDW